MYRLISASSRRHYIPTSISLSVPYTRLLSVRAEFSITVLVTHSFFLKTSQWTLPTSPSTKYAEPLYVRTEQSKMPRAPLLGVYARPDFVISHGKGSYVWDTEGRKYLDFSAGIAVNSLGHADEGVLKVCILSRGTD